MVERISELVAELGNVTEQRTPSGYEFGREGTPFAIRELPTDVIEMRLGADVAEAAMRTPDTAPSSRGPDWVRFAPATWDKFATDRLDAWFRVAWRLAGRT